MSMNIVFPDWRPFYNHEINLLRKAIEEKDPFLLSMAFKDGDKILYPAWLYEEAVRQCFATLDINLILVMIEVVSHLNDEREKDKLQQMAFESVKGALENQDGWEKLFSFLREESLQHIVDFLGTERVRDVLMWLPVDQLESSFDSLFNEDDSEIGLVDLKNIQTIVSVFREVSFPQRKPIFTMLLFKILNQISLDRSYHGELSWCFGKNKDQGLVSQLLVQIMELGGDPFAPCKPHYEKNHRNNTLIHLMVSNGFYSTIDWICNKYPERVTLDFLLSLFIELFYETGCLKDSDHYNLEFWSLKLQNFNCSYQGSPLIIYLWEGIESTDDMEISDEEKIELLTTMIKAGADIKALDDKGYDLFQYVFGLCKKEELLQIEDVTPYFDFFSQYISKNEMRKYNKQILDLNLKYDYRIHKELYKLINNCSDKEFVAIICQRFNRWSVEDKVAFNQQLLRSFYHDFNDYYIRRYATINVISSSETFTAAIEWFNSQSDQNKKRYFSEDFLSGVMYPSLKMLSIMSADFVRGVNLEGKKLYQILILGLRMTANPEIIFQLIDHCFDVMFNTRYDFTQMTDSEHVAIFYLVYRGYLDNNAMTEKRLGILSRIKSASPRLGQLCLDQNRQMLQEQLEQISLAEARAFFPRMLEVWNIMLNKIEERERYYWLNAAKRRRFVS